MTTLTPTPHDRSRDATDAGAATCRGHVHYLFAFDIAYDTRRHPVETLLGEPVSTFAVSIDRRTPRELFFFRPLTATLPPIDIETPAGPAPAARSIKFFPVGALSVTLRVPFEGLKLAELAAYHESAAAAAEARRVSERAMADLDPMLIRPVPVLADDEAYTVFCLEADPETGAGILPTESWLDAHRRDVAAMLLQEDCPLDLAEQEIRESTGKALSYYRHDLAVIDWDAAVVIDRPGQFESVLHVMELANVQLAELEAYDRMLDEALQRAYTDLATYRLRRRGAIMHTLRDFRIDMARLSDELSNTTKFLGDWHLARIYRHLQERFHLDDWRRTIESKVQTLASLYGIVKQDQMNFWMIVLEVTIVVLFVLDLIVLVLVGG